MSASSIMLFVGATTLVAALVTLCAFQMNAAKLERRINRRYRTLEGPVPGHRSLSSVGLNAEAARRKPSSAKPETLKSTSSQGHPADSSQEPISSPSPEGEVMLNSAQTIQARSAALLGDGQQAMPEDLESLTVEEVACAQQEPEHDASDGELDERLGGIQPESPTEKAGGVDGMTSSSVAVVEPGAQTIAATTPSPRRAKRAGVQSKRIESPYPSLDEAPLNALANTAARESGEAPQWSGTDNPVGQGDGLIDVFGGLNVAEDGTQGLTDDLGDIDGGGLPEPARIVTRKSRRWHDVPLRKKAGEHPY